MSKYIGIMSTNPGIDDSGMFVWQLRLRGVTCGRRVICYTQKLININFLTWIENTVTSYLRIQSADIYTMLR